MSELHRRSTAVSEQGIFNSSGQVAVESEQSAEGIDGKSRQLPLEHSNKLGNSSFSHALAIFEDAKALAEQLFGQQHHRGTLALRLEAGTGALQTEALDAGKGFTVGDGRSWARRRRGWPRKQGQLQLAEEHLANRRSLRVRCTARRSARRRGTIAVDRCGASLGRRDAGKVADGRAEGRG
jgi:hypothetical protein